MNFKALQDYLHTLTTEWGVPACAMTVHVGRETVFESFENCASNDVFWMYSATKVFTATMFCRLLERGILKLTDTVSDYLPEYSVLVIAAEDGMRRKAEKKLTLGHLITMCGGLTYDIFNPLITGASDRTTRGIAREIAGMPIVAEPGEVFLYSLCHDVLAAVMEAATGMRFSDLLRKEITEPLGMRDTCFHPGEEQLRRLAPQFVWRDRAEGGPVPCPGTNQFCFSEDYDSGGAGLCSTVPDYILLTEALANGGFGRDGYPLLKPETIDRMRTDMLGTSQRATFLERWGRYSAYGYGLGVRTRISGADGGKSPVGEFGWDGAAGAYCLADPENRISVFYAQHVLNMGPVYEEIHPHLRDLVYEGIAAD